MKNRQVGMKNSSYLPTCEDGTEFSETSAYKIQTPGNYPEESIQQMLKNQNKLLAKIRNKNSLNSVIFTAHCQS